MQDHWETKRPKTLTFKLSSRLLNILNYTISHILANIVPKCNVKREGIAQN